MGDRVRLSGYSGGHSERHPGRQISETLPAGCKGPLYLVGDDVTAIESDEPEIIQVANSDIYFRRQKTKEVGFTPLADTADGYGPPWTLTLEDDCILLVVPDGRKYVPEWPAGFIPHLESGQLEVRNGGGRRIARVGERLRIRGSVVQEHIGGVSVPECGTAVLLHVKQIINADLPLAFLKHGDRWKREANQAVDSIHGTVDVINGCMHINYHFLLWPSDYHIEEEGDLFRVMNAAGMVVARRDEIATLKGHHIRSNDKFGPAIVRTMPIDCPVRTYWIVTVHE